MELTPEQPVNQVTFTNPINEMVQLAESSSKSLSLQIGGQAPFIDDNDQFDSSRPLVYIYGDESLVYIYLFCPNVTKGSSYKKWSLVNIWNMERNAYIHPIRTIFTKCPHSLLGQTLILGTWSALW